MNILSLYDGISCGRAALDRAGITVERYVAYEIAPNAIEISRKNYPDIEHNGDVCVANFQQYSGFDILMGGSPCQNMSTLGDRKGLSGKKSKLFYEFPRAIAECNPKYFIFENNANMPQKDKEEITKILGVEPNEINSNLFVPQNRNRFYWVGKLTADGTYNTIHIKKPHSTNRKTLKDILLPTHEPITLVPSVIEKIPLITKKFGYIPPMFNPYNMSEIKDVHPCLTASGNRQTTSSNVLLYDGDCFSMLSPVEWERLQSLPDNYTFGLKNGARKNLIGNGWTVDVIVYILEEIKKEFDFSYGKKTIK